MQMQWHFGGGIVVAPIGLDSNDNQNLVFGGIKVPLPKNKG